MERQKRRGFFSRRVILGATVAGAMVFMSIGVILWGGFNTVLDVTNTMGFCISCHEMEANVYQEFKGTVHDANRSGVGASCPDCHVPRPWVHKVVRKIRATNEVYHWLRGSVDTPEKFDAHRLKMAKRVWRAMKETDSRECRNCHSFETMDPAGQRPRARKQHQNAMERGNTCIDCHKGIAHKPVHKLLSEEEVEELERPDPDLVRVVPAWFIERMAEAEAAEKLAKQETRAQQEKQKARQQERTKQAVQDTAAEYQSRIQELEARLAAGEALQDAETSEPAGGTAQAQSFGINWDKAPEREVTVFYPGQASMEWVLNGRDHSGVRPFKAGDRCADCHDQEAAAIGDRIVSGEILEPEPIPGKRGSIPVTVQATYDDDHLYLRFRWPQGDHAPVPFVKGGKMDPDHPMKFAVMLSSDEPEFADRAGCWGTCHHDLRTMPHAPDEAARQEAGLPLATQNGITKYLKESRTKLEIRGRGGKPRGGWNRLRESQEISEALDAGQFMDLLRYQSGNGAVEDGYVLAERVTGGGQGFDVLARLESDDWVLELRRKLSSTKAGDVSLEPGQLYNIGFAIHDDFSDARYHHVSLGYRLGFDDDHADINAVRR